MITIIRQERIVSDQIANFSAKALAQCIDAASSKRRLPSPYNREALASAISDFHNTCGLAPATMSRSLERIRRGGTIVRLAHQPNFLPYENLLLQIRYLHHLTTELAARGHDAVAVVFLVDHDVGGNLRFRNSDVLDPHTPSLTKTISYPIVAPHRLISEQPVPSPDYFVDLSCEIAEISRRTELSGEASHRPSIEVCKDIVPNITSSMKTVHITAFAWLRVAYLYGFAPDLLFVPLSSLYSHLRTVYLEINARLGPDATGYERYWVLCTVCRGRQSVRISRGEYFGECTNCRLAQKLPDPSRDESLRVVPRVLLDDLCDYAGLDVEGGTAYGSGRSHLVTSHSLGRQIGMTLAPEATWRVNVLHTGSAGRVAFDRSAGSPPSKRLREIVATGRMGLGFYLALPMDLIRLRDAFDTGMESDKAPLEIKLHPAAPRALEAWLRSLTNG